MIVDVCGGECEKGKDDIEGFKPYGTSEQVSHKH
jgi:hypothetical protein